MPVIPATQEAEAGELPEPRRRRLRRAEITPLHSNLGNKSETPSQKVKDIFSSLLEWPLSEGLKIKDAVKDVEKGDSCTVLLQPLWRAVWSFLRKLKIELPYNLAIPLLCIYPKEKKSVYQRDNLHSHVY